MSARHVFVAMLTVFAVLVAVVCARRSDQNRMESARTESNRLIGQVNDSSRELNVRFGLTLVPLVETVPPAVRAREFDWNRLSVNARRLVLKKLFDYVALTSRIFELGAQEGVRLEGGVDQLKRAADTAWLFYLSGKKFEGKLAVRAGKTKHA